MLKPFRRLVHFTSSARGAKITLVAWLLVVIIISALAPSAKDYETNSSEGSVKQDMPSEIAQDILEEEFPTDDGLTALLVFHKKSGITASDRENIVAFSEWVASDDKPEHVTSAIPFHHFPDDVQAEFFSDDESTLLFHVALEADLNSNDSYDTLHALKDKMEEIGLGGMQLEITGPAGILSDTISLFKNADVVLILTTVALIFLILIIIYRSPILAITPLIIAGIVYGVVDRVLGIAGKMEWFAVDSAAVSIMLVLLFAVLTDYSLFVFSRYREELSKQTSKYDSMQTAMYHVSEPILFSGGTVFLAMLTLFVTIFEPYNHFAAIFSVAVIIILIAGLTLIPAMFALIGRRAFWPFIPKVGEKKKERIGFWRRVSKLVMNRPAVIASVVLVVLFIGVFNVTSMKFSFNLLKSFPEDISSRIGFEQLEENYPAGELAPVDIVLHSEEKIDLDDLFIENINNLQEQLEKQDSISSVGPDVSSSDHVPRNFISESERTIHMELILEDNPYEVASLNVIEHLRDIDVDLLKDSGFDTDTFTLHYAGQTAEQVDVKAMNKRDMIFLFTLVTVLLTVVLGFQTRSFLLPLLMMGTILLSFVASLGFSWLIFKNILGYDAISYRLPVYTFIFMVALGIDYNIMLVSRIRENAKQYAWREAVGRGVALTGGVISSAGLILAATFSVLMTQPLQELFLFGFVMGIGILLDTFIIRGFLLPSLLLLTHKEK